MTVDREPTRRIGRGELAELNATAHSRGTYPRPARPPHPEDELLSRFDIWDRRPDLAPRPIRRRAARRRWARVALLVAAAVVLGVLIGWFGVPAVPR